MIPSKVCTNAIIMKQFYRFNDQQLKINCIFAGKAMTQTFNLAKGVTCEGCYAFLGAGLLIIIDYVSVGLSYNIDFEAKAGGGLGFSATIAIANPTLSGVTSVNLMGKGIETATTIVSGLVLYSNFGGLNATLSGSGSATGTASYSDTQSAYMSMAVEYVGAAQQFTFPFVNKVVSTPPTYSQTSFSAASFSVNLALTASEEFRISLGSGFIEFTFSANTVGRIASSVSLPSYALVSILPGSGASDAPHSLNIVQSASPPPLPSAGFVPGDIVPIRFTYSGFNPEESTFLFYTIQKYSTEHPIMMRNFTTSPTGSGDFDANWTVPWDYSLAGEG